MRRLALFLHIYQPPTQDITFTREVVRQSYSQFTKVLKNSSRGKLTLNVVGSLSEQLADLGFSELFDSWSGLAGEGRLEFTATAAYHPLLTKLPPKEFERQVKLNTRINREQIANFRPRGFFPPEMVYSTEVARMVEGLGLEWLILDESAHPLASLRPDAVPTPDKLGLGRYAWQLASGNAKVFFRDRESSLSLAFSEEYRLEDFLKMTSDVIGEDDYMVLAMDGETFGHYHPQLLTFMAELMESSGVEMVTISELLDKYPVREVRPLPSTWGVTLEEPNQQRTFPRWDNPDNPVHRLQWELFRLALKVGEHQGDEPDILDKALHSDQFWWASHNPCWRPEMFKKGAKMLVGAVRQSSRASLQDHQKAEVLLKEILTTAENLYGLEPVNC